MMKLMNHKRPDRALTTRTRVPIWFFALVLSGCASDTEREPEGGAPPEPNASPVEPESCQLADHCVDVDVPFLAFEACCSPVTSCGYEPPPLDPETLMFFPDVPEFVAKLAAGDPNGRCVPESFFFSPQPGLWKHRVEPDEGEDILITPDCESFSIWAYILPGCCLPDNTCGLSTDESWTTLAVLASGTDAPFTKPECVTADELNRQFRDSETLASFARTRASGSCDYAALAAELPPR